MQIIKKNIPTDDISIKNSLAVLESIFDIPLDKICVFDIETTGLSAKVSNVYLIGLLIINKNEIKSVQLFADDYTSEKSILEEFTSILAEMDAVIHFNGTTFDIPYLEEKYKKHSLASPFIDVESIDLYKLVSKKRHIFPTPNLKLVSVERFVGYDRGDDSDGGECIQIYTDYMQFKYAKKEAEAEKCKDTVLKHNYDDIIGTLLACQALLYTEAKIYAAPKACFKLENNSVAITYTLPDDLRYPVDFSYNLVFEKSRKQKSKNTHSRFISDGNLYGVYSLGYDETDTIVIFQDNLLTVICPIITDEKYFFYDDYKEYFYLPDEDMAIHKSVGAYVDSSHRQKATAANCYTRKQGQFIRVPLTLELSEIFYDKDKKISGKYLLTDSLSDESSSGMSDIAAALIREFTLS